MNREFIDSVKVETNREDITMDRMEETTMKKISVPGSSNTALPMKYDMREDVRVMKRIATREIAD